MSAAQQSPRGMDPNSIIPNWWIDATIDLLFRGIYYAMVLTYIIWFYY